MQKPAIDQAGERQGVEDGFGLRAAFAAEARAWYRFYETQPHHQHLHEAFCGGDRVALLGPLVAPLNRGEPGLWEAQLAGRHLCAAKCQPSMCARADADIVAIAPVDKVVPRLAAGLCIIGDLV